MKSAAPCFFSVLLLIVTAMPAALAQSPAASEAWQFYSRYHEDPARLDTLRLTLEEALKSDRHADNFLALAHVCFTWGDIRAKNRDEKVAAYKCGREAAKQAIELAPKSVAAHFWHGVNTGRLGQIQWGFQSFSYLATIREEIRVILELDPKFVPVYALAGNVSYEVPYLLGGDLKKAEEMFRKGLELDPRFTELRVGLAKTLIKTGRATEARRELEAVLNEKAPRYRADWTMKDSITAREILKSIGGQ
jgi:tetratricopeptide (TPR) repeat protein